MKMSITWNMKNRSIYVLKNWNFQDFILVSLWNHNDTVACLGFQKGDQIFAGH